MSVLLVKGELSVELAVQMDGIYHPGLKGFLIQPSFREKLLELGFNPKTKEDAKEDTKASKEVVKIEFTPGEKLTV